MPAENYYPDDAAPLGDQSTTANPPPEEKGAEDEGAETALLPISILAGKTFEPGEEVVLKIVHIYDDEVEVEYATGKGEGEGEGYRHRRRGRPREGMAGAMERLDMVSEE